MFLTLSDEVMAEMISKLWAKEFVEYVQANSSYTFSRFLDGKKDDVNKFVEAALRKTVDERSGGDNA